MPGQQLQLGAAGHCTLYANFVTNDTAWMAQLLDELPLQVTALRLFGRRVDTPRRCSWHGDPHCHYRYSGRVFAPNPWTHTLQQLRDRINSHTGLCLNCVLVNHYRDGHDSMGWHADNEPEMGPKPDNIHIASLSLGAARRFVLRANQQASDGCQKRERHVLTLGHGSLLVMTGAVQCHYQHAIPKTKQPVGQRLNLTFRYRIPDT